jgi:hypothetical protein
LRADWNVPSPLPRRTVVSWTTLGGIRSCGPGNGLEDGG